MSVVTPTPVSASTSRRVIASQLAEVQTPPAAAVRLTNSFGSAAAIVVSNNAVPTPPSNSTDVHSPPRSSTSASGSTVVLPSSPIRPIDERGFQQLQFDFQKLKDAVHDQSQRSRAAGDLHKLLNRVTGLMNSNPPLYPVYLEIDLYQLQCRISESIEALNHSQKNVEMNRLWEKSYQFGKVKDVMKQQEKDKEEMTKKLAQAHRIALQLIRNRIREKKKEAQTKKSRKQKGRHNKRKHIDSDDDDDDENENDDMEQEEDEHAEEEEAEDDMDKDTDQHAEYEPKQTENLKDEKIEEEESSNSMIAEIAGEDISEKATKRSLKRLRKADNVSTEAELFTPTRPIPVKSAKSKTVNAHNRSEISESKRNSRASSSTTYSITNNIATAARINSNVAVSNPAAETPIPSGPTPRTPTKAEQKANANSGTAPIRGAEGKQHEPQNQPDAPLRVSVHKKAVPLPFYLPDSANNDGGLSYGRRRARVNADSSELDPFQF